MVGQLKHIACLHLNTIYTCIHIFSIHLNVSCTDQAVSLIEQFVSHLFNIICYKKKTLNPLIWITYQHTTPTTRHRILHTTAGHPDHRLESRLEPDNKQPALPPLILCHTRSCITITFPLQLPDCYMQFTSMLGYSGIYYTATIILYKNCQGTVLAPQFFYLTT